MTAEGHVYPALFMLGCGGLMLRHTARAVSNLSLTEPEPTATSASAPSSTPDSGSTSGGDDSDSETITDSTALKLKLRAASDATAKHVVRTNLLAATNGGSAFLKVLGLCIVAATMTGIIVESVGGLLAKNNLLFQAAHEAIHLSFLLSGVGALLEAYGRAPFDSWRLLLSLAFLVEALVFYGHQLEQRPPEAGMHLVMAASSAVGSASALMSVVAAPTSLVLHGLTIGVILWQGAWLVWIAVVIYSPLFGVPEMMHRASANGAHAKEAHAGMDMDSGEFMESDVYLHAGLLVVLVAATVGACFVRCRPVAGGHHQLGQRVPHVVDTHDVESAAVATTKSTKAKEAHFAFAQPAPSVAPAA